MKICIITAVYNNADTVEACLKSVLGQNYPDLEYIVIDGGSTDGTLAILDKYRARLSVLVSRRDNGVYHALNEGIRLAGGEVLGLLHADDVYADENVLARVSGVFSRTGSEAVYGDLIYTRKDGSLLRYWKAGKYDFKSLESGWMPPHPAFFARKSLYTKYGLFDTYFKIAADYELMMRFLYKHGVRAAYLPEVLVRMRVGGESNKSLSNILAKSGEDYRIMKLYGLGGLWTLLRKNFSKIPQFFASSE